MFGSKIVLWLLYIIGGFLLGSMMFSQWLPNHFLKKDVTDLSDDQNPGATNVFITCGPVWGLLCLSLDMMKGFLPVYLGFRFLDPSSLWFALVMAAPVVGHAVAPLNSFHGGKCIATTFGVLLGLFPLTHIVLLLAGIYLIFSTVLKINPNRIRSIAAFGLFGLISLISLIYHNQYAIAIGCMLISLIVIMKHSKYFAERSWNVVVHKNI